MVRIQKPASLQSYIDHLTKRCEKLKGEDFVLMNEELIECAARNKRMLDRMDYELDKLDDLTSLVTGSTGQTKEEINPMVKHRNDTAKIYADNLDALMLSERSRFKKTESKIIDKNDSFVEYLQSVNGMQKR